MTDDEIKNVREKLTRCSNEELADMIIDMAVRDMVLWHYVSSAVSCQESIEQVMDEFLEAMELAYRYPYPQIDIIGNAADACINKLDKFNDALSKIQSYIMIIDKLNKSLDDGAGFENDDDFLLKSPIENCLDRIYEMASVVINIGKKDGIEILRQYLSDEKIKDSYIWSEEKLNKIYDLL